MPTLEDKKLLLFDDKLQDEQCLILDNFISNCRTIKIKEAIKQNIQFKQIKIKRNHDLEKKFFKITALQLFVLQQIKAKESFNKIDVRLPCSEKFFEENGDMFFSEKLNYKYKIKYLKESLVFIFFEEEEWKKEAAEEVKTTIAENVGTVHKKVTENIGISPEDEKEIKKGIEDNLLKIKKKITLIKDPLGRVSLCINIFDKMIENKIEKLSRKISKKAAIEILENFFIKDFKDEKLFSVKTQLVTRVISTIFPSDFLKAEETHIDVINQKHILVKIEANKSVLIKHSSGPEYFNKIEKHSTGVFDLKKIKKKNICHSLSDAIENPDYHKDMTYSIQGDAVKYLKSIRLKLYNEMNSELNFIFEEKKKHYS